MPDGGSYLSQLKPEVPQREIPVDASEDGIIRSLNRLLFPVFIATVAVARRCLGKECQEHRKIIQSFFVFVFKRLFKKAAAVLVLPPVEVLLLL